MNIEQVKDFIRTANREELREISKMHNRALIILKEETKNQFSINDVVKINHKSINENLKFKVIKVMKKNIKVASVDNMFKTYRVDPSLLEVIKD
jgi:transcription elongation GreA/GreB family factor